MRYMLLVYGDEASQEMNEAIFREYQAFDEETKRRGLSQEGRAAQPVSTATTVRVRSGKIHTTDGPFAETKEQFGGYYILNCKDRDEAIEMAAKIPAARTGSIEVRPVMEFEQ